MRWLTTPATTARIKDRSSSNMYTSPLCQYRRRQRCQYIIYYYSYLPFSFYFRLIQGRPFASLWVSINSQRTPYKTTRSLFPRTEGLTKIDCLPFGKKTAIEIGTSAGVKIKVGRRGLWNMKKIQEYIAWVTDKWTVMGRYTKVSREIQNWQLRRWGYMHI